MTALESRPDPVTAALEAAAIPAARCGAERTRRLGVAERTLYRLILDRFAQATPPSAEAIRERAQSLGLNPAEALARLVHEDLVHADEHGAILVAYPFSAHSRGHRVLIDNTHAVEAMCAIDALGIAPMLDLPIEINSRDPVTGGEIWVRLDPGEGAWWEPETALVLAGSSCCEGPNFRGCCDVLNFFESHASAERYLRDHAELAGLPISIPDAIEAGRAIFGDIFKET
jgi:hypothetical protein